MGIVKLKMPLKPARLHFVILPIIQNTTLFSADFEKHAIFKLRSSQSKPVIYGMAKCVSHHTTQHSPPTSNSLADNRPVTVCGTGITVAH